MLGLDVEESHGPRERWVCNEAMADLRFQVLSRYLAYRYECDPSYLRGKKILELGSGTGLVGIAAGLLERSAEVWVTDQK